MDDGEVLQVTLNGHGKDMVGHLGNETVPDRPPPILPVGRRIQARVEGRR